MSTFRTAPFLGLSALLHLAFLLVLKLRPEPLKTPDNIEVSIVERVVDTPDTDNTQDDPKAHMLGKRTQKALDRFIPSRGGKDGGLPKKNAPGGDGGPLTAEQEAILSTREFTYYTYYARVKGQLEPYWKDNLRAALLEPPDTNAHIRRPSRVARLPYAYTTRCLITLDKAGNLLYVHILRESGRADLDRAALDALKAAAPFPHPPAGMIDEDGKIRMLWEFIAS